MGSIWNASKGSTDPAGLPVYAALPWEFGATLQKVNQEMMWSEMWLRQQNSSSAAPLLFVIGTQVLGSATGQCKPEGQKKRGHRGQGIIRPIIAQHPLASVWFRSHGICLTVSLAALSTLSFPGDTVFRVLSPGFPGHSRSFIREGTSLQEGGITILTGNGSPSRG